MEDLVIAQKTRFVLLAAALLTLVACDSHDRKGTMNHVIDPTKAGPQTTADDQKIKDMVKNSPDCLPLSQLITQWKSQTGTGFTIYVQNRDLFAGSVDTKSEGTPYQGDTTRAQLLVKAGQRPIFEERLGGDILSSTLVGSLLDVAAQTDCNTIQFNGSNDIYKIVHRNLSGKNSGTPGELTFTTATESRTYRMVNNSLEISVNLVMPLISSDKTGASTVTEHEKFSIVPGTTDGMKIKTTYANLLVSTLTNVPQDLKDITDKQMKAKSGADNAKKTTTRSKTDNFTVPVSIADMILLNASISSGKWQDSSSKTAQ